MGSLNNLRNYPSKKESKVCFLAWDKKLESLWSNSPIIHNQTVPFIRFFVVFFKLYFGQNVYNELASLIWLTNEDIFFYQPLVTKESEST